MYCIGNASQAKLRDRVAKRRPSLVRFECRRCCSEIMFHTQHNGYLPSASSPSCKWWVPWWALSVCPIRITVQTSGPKVGSDMLIGFPQAIVTQGEDELMRSQQEQHEAKQGTIWWIDSYQPTYYRNRNRNNDTQPLRMWRAHHLLSNHVHRYTYQSHAWSPTCIYVLQGLFLTRSFWELSSIIWT